LVFLFACKQRNPKSNKTQTSNKIEKQKSQSENKQADQSSKLNEKWIGVEEVDGDAEAITYQQDKSFKGENYKAVIYLASFPNGNICALNKEHSVLVMKNDGTELLRFNPDLKGRISAIAIDETNLIHVFPC